MIKELNNCISREKARKLIKHMTKRQLLKFAYENDIFVKNNLKKEEIIDRVVASTVGANKKYEILMGDVENENM